MFCVVEPFVNQCPEYARDIAQIDSQIRIFSSKTFISLIIPYLEPERT